MPPLPSYTTPTLAAIQAARVESRWEGRGNTFIPASDAAHECARAIWHGFRWASPPESLSARKIRLFSTGQREEKRILADLADVPDVQLWDRDPQTGQQWRAEIAGYIAVKPDAVCLGLPEAPQSPHVVECKSANDKNFKLIKKKGVAQAKPEHWLQCQLQMMALGLRRALYYVVNKNDDEEYVERVKADPEVTERAVARLIEIAEAPRAPGRIREDDAKPPCLFCRHKGVCHAGEQARVTCRTCISSTPQPGGMWRCEHWGIDLNPEEQAEGCPAHLFIPDLVAGEQIDASELDRTITYQMRDGSVWQDGQGVGVAS